ncbi:MAG: SDR family oxidoreductase, partial [Elusimicrobiota bacterium]
MTALSVIVPVYNAGAFLKIALDSILAERLPGLEVIVVDDGSTDGAISEISHLPVRVVRQKNRGEAAARNAGVKASTAPFVTFLDADDLLTPGALPQLIKDAVTAFGRIDGLVNNASSFYATPVGAIDERAWDELIGANLKAPLFLSQAAAPELRKTQGVIVNIIDIHAELPMKNHVVYNVAKGGLLALTRSLARELGPQVRVNGVSPGTVLWPDDPAWQNDIERQRIVNQTLLKRTGEPDDIAMAVEF